MLAGVNGEEGVARCDERRKVVHAFQVVGIRAPGLVPLRRFDCAFGIIHHLLRCASRAGVFADGLLGENGSKVKGRMSEGLDMSAGGKTQSVAEAKGRGEVEGREHN